MLLFYTYSVISLILLAELYQLFYMFT